MGLVGCMPLVYKKIKVLNIHSVLMTEKWMLILKAHSLDYQNSSMMGLHI